MFRRVHISVMSSLSEIDFLVSMQRIGGLKPLNLFLNECLTTSAAFIVETGTVITYF